MIFFRLNLLDLAVLKPLSSLRSLELTHSYFAGCPQENDDFSSK